MLTCTGYVILQDGMRHSLVSRVEEYVGFGFVPSGAVAVTYQKVGFFSTKSDVLYTQAMVKYENKEKEK